MKKTLFLFSLSLLLNLTLKAQVTHSHWKLSTTKINDCEYDLVFNVTLDKGWHTFSVVKPKVEDEEISPTDIIFKADKSYTLVGGITETKPTPEYDPTIKKTVMLHYNKVVFTQRIKLSSAGKVKINGTYENQTCNDEICDKAPIQKFNFDLHGITSCLK